MMQLCGQDCEQGFPRLAVLHRTAALSNIITRASCAPTASLLIQLILALCLYTFVYSCAVMSLLRVPAEWLHC